jgi:FixJ family two-component response regulator
VSQFESQPSSDMDRLSAYKFWLEIEGLTVHSYATEAELLAEGEFARCDCLVVDEKIPETSGLRLIAQLRDRNFSAPAILITGQPSLSLRDQESRRADR